MNDFTKEDLNQIFDFIERHKQDSYDDLLFREITNKLQSMIDKYCDTGYCFIKSITREEFSEMYPPVENDE